MRPRGLGEGGSRSDRPGEGGALHVHIDRMVIDGIDVGGRQLDVERGLVHEMTSLLKEPHAWAGQASTHRLTAPAIELTAPVLPESLGRAIARSIHACLGVEDA